MIFLLLRMLFRRTWIAGGRLCLLWGALLALQLAGLWGPRAGLFGLVLQVDLTAMYVVLLVRFGLLAVAGGLPPGRAGPARGIHLDPSSPLFGIGLFVTAVALALAAWGFQASIVGRPLNDDTLLET